MRGGTDGPEQAVGPGRGDVSGQAGDRRRLTVADDASGRIDAYLADRLRLSRSRVASLIVDGCVLVDGRPAKKSDPVAPGQEIEARVPPPMPARAKAQKIPLEIVYQDHHLVVVNKPAGLVVHPAPGHPDGTLVNALLHHVGDLSGIGGELRPGIVHRLDRDTSGLLVAAKTDLAHRALSDALRDRRVGRIYLAALWGRLADSPVVVDRPIARHARDRTRMAVSSEGRPSRTRFRQLEAWPAACLCEAELGTGRTHQIRVHAAAIGHPVVCDATYGAGRERGFAGDAARWAMGLSRRTPRQFLHARRLSFVHPATDEAMEFEAPLPSELVKARAWARDTSASKRR